VLFPASEIADVSHTANISSLGSPCPFYCFIQLKRKEHQLFSLPFLFQCLFNFFFYPQVSDEMLREYQEQFAIYANGPHQCGYEIYLRFLYHEAQTSNVPLCFADPHIKHE
jgi:hypothetical protein